MEDFFHAIGHIWDYAPEIMDARMTDKFAALFTTWAVARISDPAEMIPSFDDDEEVDEGGGDGGGGDGGDGRGGGRGRQGEKRRLDRGRLDRGRRGERGVDGGAREIQGERVGKQVAMDRGRGGLAIRAREEEWVGEVLAMVGGYDDFR